MNNLCFAAIILVATVIAINGQTDSKSILRRGDALVAQEKYNLAIEEYGKVSTRDRDAYTRATYNIGVCYYELWQTDDAIEFYKRHGAEMDDSERHFKFTDEAFRRLAE